MVWNGEKKKHSHLSYKNIANFILFLIVALPSIFLVRHLYDPKVCDMLKYKVKIIPESQEKFILLFSQASLMNLEALCELAISYPVLMTNFLFFWNVAVLFWVIGQVQKSYWLLDVYWAIIPPLIAHQYNFHPLNASNHDEFFRSKSTVVIGDSLTSVIHLWSARSTINYLQREDFKFGQREDYRMTKLQKQLKSYWPLISFFTLLWQQASLVGLTLPLYTGYFEIQTQNYTFLGFLFCFIFIIMCHISDKQLDEYIIQKKRRITDDPVLNTGLWRYLRHPNYFSEIAFWISFWFTSGGKYWTCLGIIIKGLTFIYVIKLSEEKILSEWPKERAEYYRQYQQQTAGFIPFIKYKIQKQI